MSDNNHTPSPCPFCGMELTLPNQGNNWRHPENEACFIGSYVFEPRMLEKFNRRVSPWQPIGEAPLTIPLSLFCNGDVFKGSFNPAFNVWQKLPGGDVFNPTHFQPLP